MSLQQIREQAWTLHRQGNWRGAEALYRQLVRQGLAEKRLDRRDAINLGGLLRHLGRLKEAQQHYKDVLQALPDDSQLRANAINSFLDGRNLDEGMRISLAGLQLTPRDPTLLEAHGRLLLAQAAHEKAAQSFRQLLIEEPNQLNGLLGLGQALDGLQRWEEALTVFQTIEQFHPQDPRGPTNHLLMLQRLGRHNEAVAMVQKLPSEMQSSIPVQAAIANLFMDQQDYQAAEPLFAGLCDQEPDNPAHWLNHAATLKALKYNNACCRAVKQGLQREPLNRDLKQALGQSLAEMGRHQAALNCLLEASGDWDSLNSTYVSNLQFIGASYDLISSEQRQDMARRWETRCRKEGVGALWGDRIREPRGNRPLRVGYLSADFTSHPVGRFIAPVLANHERTKVTVVGINCGPQRDEFTTTLQSHCDEWIDIQFGTDVEAARVISDQQLDVLVELGGFTAHNRMGVLAHRPAPMQLSYLGYCAPTYLDCIDGWIGDEALFEGLNNTDHSAHELLKVAGGYMAFIPEKLPKLKATTKERPFRFGCFNHARKLTDGCIRLFCDVMDQSPPEAELLIKSVSFVEPEERERIRRRFEQAGLARNRLSIEPWVAGWENHMDLYANFDIALDTIPYGGATTSCEALLMGVPVLTLAGPGMIGRLSSSILNSAELGQWVAQDREQFVELAREAATHNKVRDLNERNALREHVLRSPLCDAQRLSRELERIYGVTNC